VLHHILKATEHVSQETHTYHNMREPGSIITRQARL
jgi:hypothetical protein